MRKRILMLSALAIAATGTWAKVKLPHVLGDNMVIQQSADVTLWGDARPGATVKITPSWADVAQETRADKAGKWRTTVATPAADGTKLAISFDDGDGAVTISNVLAGEVWVCAGQSNMEMPIRGFWDCPVEGYNEIVANAAADSLIRFVKIPSIMSMTPLADTECEWKQCQPSTVADASAVGYFFARTVTRATGVPVGLLMANKGGTRVESWLDEERLRKYTDEPLDTAGIVAKHEWDFHRALVWGNGTFAPISNCTVNGILFYQGCSNVGAPGNQYSERLGLLIEQWRETFGRPDLPFYIVEIAPHYFGDANATWGARLREQQFRAYKTIPNTSFVCTNDCVYPWEPRQIHPTQKRKVGERLGWMALNKMYGMDEILCESPSYTGMTVSGDTCIVAIDNTYHGISRLEELEGFEIAGADKVFHAAQAVYLPQRGIAVRSDEVPAPVAVRYCFKNFQLGNVANMAGLPLVPFRTDDWEE